METETHQDPDICLSPVAAPAGGPREEGEASCGVIGDRATVVRR